MAAIASPTGYFSTSRRSACDRCRKSKLRCPPREGDNQPCARCVRAGVGCFTGYTQPLGRTSKDRSTGQIHRQLQAHPREIRKAVLPSPSPSTSQSSTTQNQTNHPAVNTAISWLPADTNQPFSLPARQDIVPTPIEGAGPEAWSDIFGAFLQTPAGNEADISRSAGSGYQIGGFVFPDSNESLDLQTPPDTGSSAKPYESPQLFEHYCMPTLGHNVDSMLSASECHIQLSQLDADVCQHLRTCLRMAERTATELWEAQDAVQQGGEVAYTNANPSTSSNALGNVLGDALSSTQKYGTILQSYEDKGFLSTREGAQKPPISLICALHLLLSYCRIVALFDCLLVNLHRQLSRHPGASVSQLQSLSGLQSGGFQVHHPGLQARILIQVVQHQFKLMEDILGLPTDLRVTEHRGDVSHGLLADDSARELLHAIAMQQVRGKDEENADGQVGLGSVASLRDNIARLQSLSESDVIRP
ncbi:hypothetical protein Hte_008432 [Hypoxylon texense]